MSTVRGLRISRGRHGAIYVARDREEYTSIADHCEHAVLVDGKVEWEIHGEGGDMSPLFHVSSGAWTDEAVAAFVDPVVV